MKSSWHVPLAITKSSCRIARKIVKSSWHVPLGIMKSSWHVRLEILKSRCHAARKIVKSSWHVRLGIMMKSSWHAPLEIIKLRFHIFNSWNLKEASHESYVFTSSTLGIGRKHRTKALFSHLQLLEVEGSLAGKLCFHIFKFGIWRKPRTKASFSRSMDAIWMLGFARNIFFWHSELLLQRKIGSLARRVRAWSL